MCVILGSRFSDVEDLMDVISIVSVSALLLIPYLIVGLTLMIVEHSVWKMEWVTTSRRMLAACFFPLAYYVDGKIDTELAYPIFGKHGRAVYAIISMLTWPLIATKILLALYLGFCRAYVRYCSGPVSNDPDED